MPPTSNLAHFWKIALKSLPGLLLVSAAAALVVFAALSRLAPMHQAHFSYVVALAQREESTEYRFDGYYALQATELFAETLAQWLMTPDIIVSMYEEANIPLPTTSSRHLMGVVRAEQAGPQLIEVVVRHKSPHIAERLANALQTVMQQRIQTYHDQGIPQVQFKAVPTTVWVGMNQLSAPLISTAVFAFVFFFGLNAILFLETLKRQKAE